MRRRWLIGLATLVVLLGGTAAAAYAYDASHDDVLADGVTVAGLSIGGMHVDVARASVTRALAPRVRRPLTVRFRHRTFKLRPLARANVAGMLDDALAQSRAAALPTRVVRALTGRPVRVDVPLRVTYSRPAVARFVGGIEQALERRPRNARMDLSPLGPRTIRSRAGVLVRTRVLARSIGTRLRHPDGPRLVRVPTRLVQPKTTTKELRARYPFFLAVNRERKELRLFRRLKLVKVYRVAVGQIGYSTPAGVYRIRTKAINPAWLVPNSPWTGSLAGQLVPGGVPWNPLKARWLGFYGGAGIHGTADIGSLGSAASHGCIRMSIPDVIELYERVPLRTPLSIV